MTPFYPDSSCWALTARLFMSCWVCSPAFVACVLEKEGKKLSKRKTRNFRCLKQKSLNMKDANSKPQFLNRVSQTSTLGIKPTRIIRKSAILQQLA